MLDSMTMRSEKNYGANITRKQNYIFLHIALDKSKVNKTRGNKHKK